MSQKHELLLPVGNLEMALAAIHNGADAIYLGVPGFNARGRSRDFQLSELREMIETAHLYGVKANLALNIVIFENEFVELVPLLERIIELKPDAFIVQDLGLACLLRQMAPEQVIHASTQMTVTNADAIALLEGLKIKRFVLGRENSLQEIEKIAQATDRELEVFVHGALCVSYSGQCFTSESIGGRSANRGQCAQSCRFSYELLVDGEVRDLDGRKFLVSPQDLCGLDEIPRLKELGVASFKIEGRLKSTDYVATAARSYRRALDQAEQGLPLAGDEKEKLRRQMAVSYSRGFFPGWLHGVSHQNLVSGAFSAHRGLFIGEVAGLLKSGFILKTDREIELENGDGLLWVMGEQEQGGPIYDVRKDSAGRYRVEFSWETEIGPQFLGAKVYLNHDRDLKNEVGKSWQDRQRQKRIGVSLWAQMKLGEPLKLRISDGKHVVEGSTASALVLARTAGLGDDFLREEFSSLGGTVFFAREIQIQRSSEDPMFLSHKELKELRRQVCEELAGRRKSQTIDGFSVNLRKPPENTLRVSAASEGSQKSRPKLNLLLRDREQVQDLVQYVRRGALDPKGLNWVVLDFEFGRDFENSLGELRAGGIRSGIATTRILKPGEYVHLKAIARLQPDVILVRNLGALHYFRSIPDMKSDLIGDFSLNVANHWTAEYLLGKGLQSVCASYDLNRQQLSDLLKSSPAEKIEMTIHQYMPSFHMEHCVFASCLSDGNSYRDCGKPCERHRVELRDQFDHGHFIKADQECRNTMFNAVSQTALRYLPEWQELGLGAVRLEALFERGEDLLIKVVTYQKVLAGETTIDVALQRLGVVEKYGLGEGAVARIKEYRSLKK